MRDLFEIHDMNLLENILRVAAYQFRKNMRDVHIDTSTC